MASPSLENMIKNMITEEQLRFIYDVNTLSFGHLVRIKMGITYPYIAHSLGM